MRRSASAVLVAAALLLAPGCGGDDDGQPIPRAQADDLVRRLDSVRNRVAQGSVGACEDAIDGDESDLKLVQQQIDSLPPDVDSDLRNALQESFNRLFELVSDRCQELRADEPTETVETVETLPTETIPTETLPTETVPAPTETEPSVPEEQTPPTPDTGNGDGDGGDGGPGEGGDGGGGAGAEGDDG